MSSEVVKHWFGDSYSSLHPLLQQVHENGGRLVGSVEVAYGNALARRLGRGLARKMQLPGAGTHQLVVDISHDSDGMHWGRSFNGNTLVYSLFKPVGTIENGYWTEQTGPISMQLTVDIKNGGWYWRCLRVKYRGLAIPRWLVPRTTLYKVIENDRYRFHVELALPLVGTLFSYQGLLRPELNSP